MSDIGGGGSAFDQVFLWLQVVGVVLWALSMLLLATGAPSRAWFRAGLALQVAVSLGAPLVWNLGFPPSSGIEGAGRVLLGAPSSLFNGLLGCGWAGFAARRADRPVLRALGPFGLVLGLCAVGWVAFLFA